jgi:hypothetical protein
MSRGDVFGWSEGIDEFGPFALLFVDEGADVNSFPATIGGIRIRPEPLPRPELYSLIASRDRGGR